MPKKVNFADVITYDNLGNFISAILGGRRPLIRFLPSPGSTINNSVCEGKKRTNRERINQCAMCRRKRVDNDYYCYRHVRKNRRDIVRTLINEHANSLRSAREPITLLSRIETLKQQLYNSIDKKQ